MATIADLVIGLRTDTSKLKSGLGGAMGSVRSFKQKATRGLGKVGKSAMHMGASLGKAAAVGSLAAGGAIAAFAVKGVSAFDDFEKGMNEVFTLMPGASEAAMGKMTQDVKRFGREFGTLSSDTIPALYGALSAGVPSDNVFEFLEVAQKASIGGVTELSVAVDGISSVINAYGDKAESASAISDKMFTAVRLGKTNFDELSKSLFNVLPTAAGLGVKFGEVTAAMAALTAAGTPTSVATTQLRALMNELAKGTGAATKAFNEATSQTFPAFIAAGGTLSGALQIVKDASDSSGLSMVEMFHSVEAGSAALSLTSGDMQTFVDDLGEMKQSAGATETAYGKFGGGLSLAFGKVKAAGELLLVAVGEKLAPVFIRFANWLVDKAPIIQRVVVSAFDTIAKVVGGLGTTVVKLAEGDWKGAMAELQNTGKTAISAIENALNHLADVVMAHVTEKFTKSVDEWIAKIFDFKTYWDGIKDFAGQSLGDLTGVSVGANGNVNGASALTQSQRSAPVQGAAPAAIAMGRMSKIVARATRKVGRMSRASKEASAAIDNLTESASASEEPQATLAETMGNLASGFRQTSFDLSQLSISKITSSVENAVSSLADLPIPLLDDAVGGLLEQLGKLSENASSLGLDDLGQEVDGIIATLSAAAGTPDLKNAVDSVVAKFKEIDKTTSKSLQGAMDDVAEATKDAANGMAEDIPSATAAASTSIESMADKVDSMLSAAVEKMSAGMNNLADVFKGSMHDATTAMQDAMDAIPAAISSMRDAFIELTQTTKQDLTPAVANAATNLGAFGRGGGAIELPGGINLGYGAGNGGGVNLGYGAGLRSASSRSAPPPVNVNVHVAGSVMAERDLTLAVRRGLGTIARQNVTSGVF